MKYEEKPINTDLIFDTVLKISTSKVYGKKNQYYNKKIWILHCKENNVKILPETFENDNLKDFFEEVLKGKVLNKMFRFEISKLEKKLVSVESLSSE